MFHALSTAASGMTAQQINLDNIANNLANGRAPPAFNRAASSFPIFFIKAM